MKPRITFLIVALLGLGPGCAERVEYADVYQLLIDATDLMAACGEQPGACDMRPTAADGVLKDRPPAYVEESCARRPVLVIFGKDASRPELLIRCDQGEYLGEYWVTRSSQDKSAHLTVAYAEKAAFSGGVGEIVVTLSTD